MNVLLTNDDGINGEGLIRLREVLQTVKDIKLTVIAPDSERSASSHRITIFEPLILKEIDKNTFTLSGTPADCVKIALDGFLKEKVDLVVSGVNNGPNMGIDTFYSGTVAAAREACFHSIPAVAFSIDGYTHEKEFDTATHFALIIIRKLLLRKLPNNILLNVNIPNVKKEIVRGIKVTSLGNRIYRDQVIEREAPFGWKYFWIGGELPGYGYKENSDFNTVENNFVSLTPLQQDNTAYSTIDELIKWDF
ncbi:MAG: 5'/3'-nucleotidase SurE [Spirochaetota bacterium]|nr:5'/3'-nucleotidase SurE [Spirochaetota bacterium]